MNQKLSILILLSTVLLGACSNQTHEPERAPDFMRNVSVIELHHKNVADILEAVGSIRAMQTTTLASRVAGNIVQIRVQEGDRVHRGQVLAVIDDSQPRASADRATAADSAARQQLLAAESDLALAESTLKRYQTLYERKSASPQEFDEVRARRQAAFARRDMARADQEQAKAALVQARTTLSYTRVLAPFDGIVTEKKVDSGTLAFPGMPLLTVEDVRRYRLEASVNENDLAYVRITQSVPVSIDALGAEALKGKVVQIVPAADPGSRSFLIKIELPADARLRSGLFGRAQFVQGERQSLLVPQTAIVDRGQMQGVFVVGQDKIVALHYLTMGKAMQGQVEVLSGLEDGDLVVAHPGNLELDGKRIEVQQ
jgi:RND family efflux transporter MFP subunit